MNIEQTISLKAQEAVKALYGQDVPESMVQLQKTKREFEGSLTLVVFPFLKIQTTQRERLLAASLVDLSNIEIYRLVVWHSKISSEVFKDWDCQDFWFCEYYWLRPSCIHCCTSFFIFVSNYMLFRKTQGVLPLCHHCFRYSLGLIPSTFRNIRLK